MDNTIKQYNVLWKHSIHAMHTRTDTMCPHIRYMHKHKILWQNSSLKHGKQSEREKVVHFLSNIEFYPMLHTISLFSQTIFPRRWKFHTYFFFKLYILDIEFDKLETQTQQVKVGWSHGFDYDIGQASSITWHHILLGTCVLSRNSGRSVNSRTLKTMLSENSIKDRKWLACFMHISPLKFCD